MAKTGTITAESGADAAVSAAVITTVVPSMSLAAVAAAALQGSDDPEIVHVDFAARKVKVFKDTANTGGLSDAIASAEANAVASFSQDTPGKTAQWTDARDGGLAPLVAAAKPQLTLQALLIALENYILANPSADVGQVFIDQLASKVDVFSSTTQPALPSGTTPDAIFDQTIATPTGTVKNTFE